MSTTEVPEKTAPGKAGAGGRVLQLADPLLKGPDVEQAQRLLTSSKYGNFHPGEIDKEYGELTAGAVRRAKWALGYPDQFVNENFGAKLGAYLQGTPLPPDYEQRRKVRATAGAQEAMLRKEIVSNALWGVEKCDQIHYDMEGPRLAALENPRTLPLTTDCSAFVTLCYNWAAAPNPNGGPYSVKATAFTGTLLKHCRKIPRSLVQAGDLVVWGAGTGNHVCLVVEAGADPMLVSHGAERGPLKISFSAENQFQSGAGHPQVTWLSAF
jgi:Putative peptidoglycan binding domain